MSQLISCPECKKPLQVPDDLLGRMVQCPECTFQFTAQSLSGVPNSAHTGTTASPPPLPCEPPSRVNKPWNDDDEIRDRPSRRREYDDDDFDAALPRIRRRSSYDNRRYTPHRGGLILAFGIISIIGFMSLIFGPIAWIMGNGDLHAMREGRMDPEGEGMTQTGRILGMIATILHIVMILVGFGFFGCCMCMGIGAGAGGGNRNFAPPGRRR